MKTRRQKLGSWGEEVAATRLQERGYTILARNFHTPHGEIDIVAGKEEAIIFVEVKTRSSNRFAFPENAVNRRKQMLMLSAAECWFEQHPESPESWQFDVIAVTGKPSGEMEIEHFENVLA